MKEKKIAIIMWAVMLSASIFADVYYNNKTFTESETTSEVTTSAVTIKFKKYSSPLILPISTSAPTIKG